MNGMKKLRFEDEALFHILYAKVNDLVYSIFVILYDIDYTIEWLCKRDLKPFHHVTLYQDMLGVCYV